MCEFNTCSSYALLIFRYFLRHLGPSWHDMLTLLLPSRCPAAGGTSRSLGQSQFLQRQGAYWMAHLTYFGTDFAETNIWSYHVLPAGFGETQRFQHCWPPARLTSFLPWTKSQNMGSKQGFGHQSSNKDSQYEMDDGNSCTMF